MAIIAPTVTAFDTHEYRTQMTKVEAFADRVHIDLMDGDLAPTKSPSLQHIWWSPKITADIHLMYRHPMNYIDQLIKLKPHMVVIHNEATVHHMEFAARLHDAGIEAGLAILQDTPVDYAAQIMHSFDQLLIFSGDLGHHGGVADLNLLAKVKEVREHHPEVEIAWDGGINDQNAAKLIEAGVDVLNVGGYIMNAEDPAAAYAKLTSISD